jgi:purine-binding chemotaxis protein CheW
MEGNRALLCRVAAHLCALPLAGIVEISRPLPIQPIAGVPAFVLGVSMLRGAPAPIVDARALLASEPGGEPKRFVTLRVEARRVGLAVDDVLGIRDLPVDAARELPPLLRSVSRELVSAIGELDAELLLVLDAARLLSEPWARALERSEPPA